MGFVSDERSFAYLPRLWSNSAAILASDAVGLLLAFVLGGLTREWLFGDSLIPPWAWLVLPVWIAGAMIVRIVPGWGLSPAEHLKRIEFLLMASFGIAASALFLTQTGAAASRFTLSVSFLCSLVLIPIIRIRVKSWMVKAGRWGVPTVIYGNDTNSAHVLDSLLAEPGLGYLPYGIFDDESAPGTLIHGVPVLGTMDQNAPAAPYAIIGTTQTSRERLIELLEGPLTVYRRVVVVPDLLDAPSLWVTPRDFVGLVGLEITFNLQSPLARMTKRAMDLALVVITAPLWIPFCALLALSIWLEDRCNPFFVQERVGLFGDRFKTWKFRTMHPNAEAVLKKALEENPKLAAEWAVDCKLKNDPRTTRVGSCLRKYSLDELPQLWNVLIGEMSLVGPRPLPDYHYDQLPTSVQALRDRARPGMTGLWQVSGRSEAGTKGMERWDAYYVRNWSIWLDLVILIRTVRVVLSARGAY